LEISVDTVHEILCAGRARWKIENEVLNTLKSQDYHLDHIVGLGQKALESRLHDAYNVSLHGGSDSAALLWPVPVRTGKSW